MVSYLADWRIDIRQVTLHGPDELGTQILAPSEGEVKKAGDTW